MKIVSIITDPRVVDRILRHLESQASRARHRRPGAIPCHEFQRRPLEHWANLAPKLRTLHVCPSGAPNVARIRWGERIFRSEEHTSELQSPCNLVCRLLLEKKKRKSDSLSRSRRQDALS